MRSLRETILSDLDDMGYDSWYTVVPKTYGPHVADADIPPVTRKKVALKPVPKEEPLQLRAPPIWHPDGPRPLDKAKRYVHLSNGEDLTICGWFQTPMGALDITDDQEKVTCPRCHGLHAMEPGAGHTDWFWHTDR